jgi:hypothetical protein
MNPGLRKVRFIKTAPALLSQGERNTSMNQKTLRAPATAPKGVRNRAAAPYPGVAKGSAALVIMLGNQ